MNQLENLTVGDLRNFLAQLTNDPEVTDETKIFLDTGWDSIQEISPDALSIEGAQAFKIEDPLTHEFFGGYSLLEKAEKMKGEGPIEKVLVIRNLY
ncbi:hypothetical protein [Enterococcus xiangfangensis]|uniref:Nif11 domain-containing protein n=1 Tax=Enterococcus xiangfangensis TaxID=1296537 RepID=A0ABU3FBR2_9ENTE|nr:hypothetical protein [Enterococcus xiangfangensis]MBM7712940.1 hypothetical protein [Enterococcus xiangfangensis]MDT2760113.1 hypothetical protein [Enterococcus xiangfangensis]NBK07654.1 hypothetical protein [Enterococcus asini]